MLARPPKSTSTDTRFPYTTLIRSHQPHSYVSGRRARGSGRNCRVPRLADVRLHHGCADSGRRRSAGSLMDHQSEIVEAPERPSLPERLAEWVIVPLMLGIIAVGFAAVCLRFLFGGQYALFWSEEVIRYAFIWMFLQIGRASCGGRVGR